MDTDDEELKATKRMKKRNKIERFFYGIYANQYDMSLYEKELQEKKLIKELKMILHDGQCKPNWRETINDTIKLLGGE